MGAAVNDIGESAEIASEREPRQQRMLYMCHIDWGWIKQRPQHMAEQLRKFFDVRVLFNYSWKRRNLPNEFKISSSCLPLLHVPLRRFAPVLGKLDAFTTRLMVRSAVLFLRPDYVWLTSPELFEHLPKRLSGSVVYDCMDDALAFPRDAARVVHLRALEQELINKAAIVFVSSERLKLVLETRHRQSHKFHLLRNAFDGIVLPRGEGKARSTGVYKLGYCGTIAQWFDWELLINLVAKLQDVELHLVGPVDDGASAPVHSRIIWHGTVKHSDLPEIMHQFDCLVMPFQVTPLIESVDPVKLYEYINFGKPIITVYYDEIARFAPFVHFYRSHDEALDIISQLAAEKIGRKYSEIEREAFLSANSWAQRVSVAKGLLTAVGQKAQG